MNRATGFSRIVNVQRPRYVAPTARNAMLCVTIGNAAGTARIYIRQAKRSCRHGSKRWVFSEPVARMLRAVAPQSQYRAR